MSPSPGRVREIQPPLTRSGPTRRARCRHWCARRIQTAIDAANAELARVEQIKCFGIVPGFRLPGGDELTPTMWLERRPIATRYSAAIDARYQAQR